MVGAQPTSASIVLIDTQVLFRSTFPRYLRQQKPLTKTLGIRKIASLKECTVIVAACATDVCGICNSYYDSCNMLFKRVSLQRGLANFVYFSLGGRKAGGVHCLSQLCCVNVRRKAPGYTQVVIFRKAEPNSFRAKHCHTHNLLAAVRQRLPKSGISCDGTRADLPTLLTSIFL